MMLGEKVKLQSAFSEWSEITGILVGQTCVTTRDNILWIVELDKPINIESLQLYIHHILVDRSNFVVTE